MAGGFYVCLANSYAAEYKSSSMYQSVFIFWEYDTHGQLVFVLVLHILLHKLYMFGKVKS